MIEHFMYSVHYGINYITYIVDRYVNSSVPCLPVCDSIVLRITHRIDCKTVDLPVVKFECSKYAWMFKFDLLETLNCGEYEARVICVQGELEKELMIFSMDLKCINC